MKQTSYAQDGEDLLLDEFLKHRDRGFYVDVGAADYYSNTRLFYERGWSGLNIEPHPDSFARLKKNRPRDINIPMGVATKRGTLPFYAVPDRKTRSSFDEEVAKSCGFSYVTMQVEVAPLAEILSEHRVGIIDFMSIDTEGYEEIVLRSNNWRRYRPSFILIEIESPKKTPWDNYLRDQGYRLVTKSDKNYNALYKAIV